MFLIHDIHEIRDTCFYQEAFAEGLKKGIEDGYHKGMVEGVRRGAAIIRLAATRKKSAAQIAAILDVEVDLVWQILLAG